MGLANHGFCLSARVHELLRPLKFSGVDSISNKLHCVTRNDMRVFFFVWFFRKATSSQKPGMKGMLVETFAT